ncbi:AzlD domain-containing protein [Pseudodesulfovibrio piezophilus]|nr:AzlD domain-containing protein [Pseudodesulfovibrio piezophilus]
MHQYWIVVLGIGLGTFLIRFSFILIIDKITLPETVQRMLRFIPASVMPALVVPAVLLHKNGVATFAGWDRILAALIAVLVAWKTRSILATIGSGMVSLWILKTMI